jgi:hypothetical protein
MQHMPIQYGQSVLPRQLAVQESGTPADDFQGGKAVPITTQSAIQPPYPVPIKASDCE